MVAGETDPVAAIEALAAALIDEVGLANPPFYPQILASFRSVREVRLAAMRSAARLVPDGDALLIEVNRDHSPGKRNFSVDHEVAHTLFPTYNGQLVDDTVTGSFPVGMEEELLCDIGAAALLLDPRWLRPLAHDAGPSLQTLSLLAGLFNASLEATARKLAGLDVWPCAFVTWEPGQRKAERVPDAQIPMIGFEHPEARRGKLRVKRAYVARSFGHFIPENKSADDTSIVALCRVANEPLRGVEKFAFGRHPIRLYCESVYVPYRSGGDIIPRVISLLLPTERDAASMNRWAGYQLEML